MAQLGSHPPSSRFIHGKWVINFSSQLIARPICQLESLHKDGEVLREFPPSKCPHKKVRCWNYKSFAKRIFFCFMMFFGRFPLHVIFLKNWWIFQVERWFFNGTIAPETLVKPPGVETFRPTSPGVAKTAAWAPASVFERCADREHLGSHGGIWVLNQK